MTLFELGDNISKLCKIILENLHLFYEWYGNLEWWVALLYSMVAIGIFYFLMGSSKEQEV